MLLRKKKTETKTVQQRAPKTPKTPQTPIPALPDVPTLHLFGYLDMADLVSRAPKVCNQWAALHRQACRARTHLSLSIGDKKQQELYEHYFDDPFRPFHFFLSETPKLPAGKVLYEFPGTNHSRLTAPTLSRNFTRQIAARFPAVTAFEMSARIPSSCSLIQLAHLLRRWSPTLTTLRLWIWTPQIFNSFPAEPSSPAKVQNYKSLFNAINRCRSLRHLTVFLDDCIWYTVENDYESVFFDRVLDLPVLAHLESFKFFSKDQASILFKSLATYALTNDQLQRIELGNTLVHPINLGPQLTATFMRRFTGLSFKVFRDRAALPNLGLQAVNVRHLTVKWSGRLRRLFRHLPEFTQLTDLKIIGSYDARLLSDYDELPLAQIPSLPSVRQLHLDLNFATTHLILTSPHLRHIFPSVEKVQITHFLPHCTTCGHENQSIRVTPTEIMRCVRQIAVNWLEQSPSTRFLRLVPDDRYRERVGEAKDYLQPVARRDNRAAVVVAE